MMMKQDDKHSRPFHMGVLPPGASYQLAKRVAPIPPQEAQAQAVSDITLHNRVVAKL